MASLPWGFESPLSHQFLNPEGSIWPRRITTWRGSVRVLFVVDNGSDGSGAERLSQQQFDVDIVSVGRQLPGRIRDFRPDVLVLDVVLPHLSGVTVAELLREDWPLLPIVFTSEDFDPAESPLPTMTEFLPKPYSLDALINAIRRLTYRLPISDL